ncbi:protein NOI4-like [Argentina anserina]|uniref:protein NOI4-like n=1 Tax=Argentina anserina TaxID=57926 RepID=UPI0021762576|nr:protein NOI4-like [Potentilla anserina]
MASHEGGRSLPKFGEWDVNDPASAEGFTVIFNKARADKKNGGTLLTVVETSSHNCESSKVNNKQKYPKRNKWLCMGC